jgi:hypothetical protein
MDKIELNYLKELSFVGIILVVFGNVFNFGNYLLNLIYKPIEKQYFPAQLKNKFYKAIVIKRRAHSFDLSEPLHYSHHITT